MNEPIHQGSGHEPGEEAFSSARPRRRWPMLLLLLVLLALGTSPWWWPPVWLPTTEADLPLPAIPEAAPGANAPLPGALTFLLVADTYLGADGMEQANAGMLTALDALPGTPWPSPVGGVVDPPLALAVLGDLTNSGRAEHMRCFERLYYADPHPRRGGTVALSGNHDHEDGREMVSQRLRGWHGSPLRAWDWGEVRMLCLDKGPTESALTWLEQELAGLPAKQPLIILQHFALRGPYSGPEWVPEKHKARYAAILTGRRVLAIFHGHFHGSGHYRWQGIDVYNTGSPRHKWCEALAVHVTSDELVVASWNWQARRWWWMHRKPRAGNAPGTFTNLAATASDPPVLDPYPLEP